MTRAERDSETADGHQTQRSKPVGRSAAAWPLLGQAAVVIVASLVLGAATSWAQSVLPQAWAPLANSASGWTLLTAVLVFAARVRPRPALFLGPASFVCLVLGYTLMAEIRGFTYNPLLFGVVGLLAGPFIGLASAWLRCPGWRAALGAGVLAGVGVGEALYGHWFISEYTGVFYWNLIAVVSVVLLVVVGAVAFRPWVTCTAYALLTTAVVAAGFVVAYSGLPALVS